MNRSSIVTAMIASVALASTGAAQMSNSQMGSTSANSSRMSSSSTHHAKMAKPKAHKSRSSMRSHQSGSMSDDTGMSNGSMGNSMTPR